MIDVLFPVAGVAVYALYQNFINVKKIEDMQSQVLDLKLRLQSSEVVSQPSPSVYNPDKYKSWAFLSLHNIAVSKGYNGGNPSKKVQLIGQETIDKYNRIGVYLNKRHKRKVSK